MKFNQWTLGLAALGVISLASAVQAEEAQNQVMTALASTTLSGYVNTSAIWKFGSGNLVYGRSFDGAAKQDGFNLDVVKLQLEKPLDEGQWSAGYQVGLLFGPDANTYNTASWGFGNQDFGIKDANVTLRIPGVGNGIDVKMGYWESPIGYEVFDAGSNPNYSRSFGYSLEPKQFTGLLVSYRFNEMLSVAGGVANSGDFLTPPFQGPPQAQANTINAKAPIESLKTYLASVAFTAPESAGFLKGATIYAGIVDSGFATAPDVINYYLGGSIPTPLEHLALGACYDYRSNEGGNGYNSAHAWALAGYASYQATEKLKLNGRVDWANGSNGTWYPAPFGAKHRDNHLLGTTITADYCLWANVITRGEIRWDHELQGNGIFNDGTDKNALSLAVNLIYKF
jgi:hypothetical protein